MTNSQYLDHMYQSWRKNPNSVSSSWDSYFRSIYADNLPESATSTPPADSNQSVTSTSARNSTPSMTSTPKDSTPSTVSASIRIESSSNIIPSNLVGAQSSAPSQQNVRSQSNGGIQGESFINGALDINATIRAYQTRGHLIADTDPLRIQNPESYKLQGTSNLPPAIVVRQHLKGMTEADMDREFPLAPFTVIGGPKRSLPLREILTRLNQIYCGHLGLEYIYIHDLVVLDWLRDKFEVPGAWELPADHKKFIWMNIMRAVTFEGFLARKFPTEKRFGLEGCESFIPSLIQCLETSAEHGVESAVIGMAHRGRLNTLSNVCFKPLHQLLTQFNPIPLEGFGSGDVKYHLGTHAERTLERSKKKILIAMMANPSHLEAINGVVIGRVRAGQVEENDAQYGKKSMAILVHGDAAFSGQGVVYETMHLTNLPNYTTGGVIHLVINNQVKRSEMHVMVLKQGPEETLLRHQKLKKQSLKKLQPHSRESALRTQRKSRRATFHNDVVLDIVGYRRFGHNELDEPMLTQPLMYKRIKEHPNVLSIYSDKLLKDGVITEAFAKEEIEKYWNYCEMEFEKAKTIDSMQLSDWHDVPWSKFFSDQSPKNKIPPTGIDIETIKTICKAISTPPHGITPHAQVLRVMEKRNQLMEARQADWAIGEALAFLSLLKEGHHVRLSGQDVERGTFSHRMHIIHDQHRDKTFKNILHNVFPGQGLYTVSNSSLSEYGVCTFEIGYSAYNHNTLTMWEAQFGDFCNTCQVAIDTILSSGQTKWGRQVGLVLLLPHGLEGQGPEHSSARLERFLELCDDDCVHMPGETVEEIMTRQLFEINWIICNLTTSANLFHCLRRQIHMPFRKPLCIMTPKSLLRHPMAISPFSDMESGTSFKPLLSDPYVKLGNIQKVLMCSGKVYYDLITEREGKQLEDKIAVIRIEQICPFPYHFLAQEMMKYPNAKIMWFQEEHKNQGAYAYVRDRIALALGKKLEEVTYGGRPPSASPATGSKVIHSTEYKDIMAAAMKLD
ncbi:2-oxoglutarate dehydrogenase, mitochondrial [Melipona quadrifasciata]|uniref:2-oxoglutarate dehydrogenase, mitochondrial n=1 Tax=Melipona quadrifasciata TaxID=166423 RepID=A0A0N0BHZ2_9HYME|nr:2-oxoglutarate dehydrogenase, mitochondrial [Melipona quadrifasciata]